MFDYKNILGSIAVTLALLSYAVYFLSIYKGQTKPHGFTWFVWGTLSAVGLGAVWVSGGGSGTWVIAVNMIACYTVATIAFLQHRVRYDRFDWLALLGAFLAMFLWWLTNNPLAAILLVSISDVTGAIPTIRKAYKFPFEENPQTFIFGIAYYIFSLFALQDFSFTTSLYHFAIIAVDIVIILVVYLRRRKTLKTTSLSF